ncbi:MAG TPA: TonB family protein [Longimicrobiaceae bacterium]|nr:TonB family protein [Longimicrobiaceae bacterium]
MFIVLTSGRPRRRLLSPTTLTLSVAAHVLLIGGVVYASMGQTREVVVDLLPVEPYVIPRDVAPRPVTPPALPPQRVEPQETPPVRGDFVTPVPPDEIPTRLPDFSPSDPPLTPDNVRGDGRPGDVIGTPDPGDNRPPTGDPTPGDAVYEVAVVEERPALRNGAEVQRILQRLYPPLLRDAGISGETTLQFVIDAEGKVEAGSVRVVSTSHAGFAEPSVRAAEKLRFRPARVQGRAVRVMISLPIAWKLEGN